MPPNKFRRLQFAPPAPTNSAGCGRCSFIHAGGIRMKKILATMFLIVALVVTMFPITTTYASTQIVNCSWWGKMIHGEYNNDDDNNECSWCNGTGDCQTCDGRGYTESRYSNEKNECDDCNGTGKCSYCGGSGR